MVFPLCKIYNKSLSTGIFPPQWKTARVVPIHKSGDKTLISNYRPISILSSFAKIFECLVYPYIESYFKQFLTVHQHGFVRSRSTCTNLTVFVETLSEALDNHKQVDVVYTDFTKAFDKVSHTILLQKLTMYGYTGNMLEWIRSYLSDRIFNLVLNGYCSASYKITSGVPQGSHLGPILFNMFINDITDCFHHSTPYMFADDLKILKIINSYNDVLLLQKDLDELHRWCLNNDMLLNLTKCQHIKFTRKINKIPSSYSIADENLNEVDNIRDLGVVLDTKLTFTLHIESIIKKASSMLGFIIRNGKVFRNPKTKILLYNNFVRSVLEYCSVVWRPHYSVHSLRIERIQKRFMWHLAYSKGIAKRKYSYHDRLLHFGMNTLSKRREMLDLVFLYKILSNKIDCTALLQRLNIRVPARYPRTRITLLHPPLRKTVLGSNSPIPRMCKLLNEFGDVVDVFFDPVSRFRRVVFGTA